MIFLEKTLDYTNWKKIFNVIHYIMLYYDNISYLSNRVTID